MKLVNDKRYIGVRVREAGTELNKFGYSIYRGYCPEEIQEEIATIDIKDITRDWQQFGDLELKKIDSSDWTFEEWTADGCTPSYGCSQCKYFDECPEGQYMF